MALGTERDGEELIAQHSLGFDRGHRVILDNLVRSLVQIHEYHDLFAGLVRQSDALHRSAVNSSYLHVGSCFKTCNIVEFRPELVRGAKQILLAPDDKNPGGKNCQCHNDEYSQPCHSRHNSSYDFLRNSFTNPMPLS